MEISEIITEYAELCFDINSYNGITDYEIEYEVKKDHDYKKAFKAILKQAGISAAHFHAGL